MICIFRGDVVDRDYFWFGTKTLAYRFCFKTAAVVQGGKAADCNLKIFVSQTRFQSSMSDPVSLTASFYSHTPFKLRSHYTLQNSPWVDLLRHFNGLLQHGREARFSNSWLQHRSNMSWFAAGRKHMVCVIVSATGEHIQGASWGRAVVLLLTAECWHQMIMTQQTYLWEWKSLSQTKNNLLL